MRILYVMAGNYAGWSAGETRVQEFARGLRELGAEARVVALRGAASPRRDGEWQLDPFDIPYTFVSRDYSGTADAWRLLLGDRRRLGEAAARIARDWGADVVSLYGNSWYMLGPVALHCRHVGIPCVMDLNEWYPLRAEWYPLYWDQQLLFRRLFPAIGGVVAISRTWERHCRQRGVPVIRIPAIGEADALLPDHAPRDLGKPFRLLYMGSAGIRDLPDTLLEGVRLALQRGLDLRLAMVGNATAYPAGRKAMRKVEADRMLRERVTFPGPIPHPQVAGRLLDCDATVLLRADSWENRACFPTRLPEQLLAARPILLSGVDDIRLYFEHRRNAWVLPPGNRPKELAEALRHLADHPEEAAAIGRAGFDTALEEFSYRRHAPRLLAFLEGLLDRAGRRQP